MSYYHEARAQVKALKSITESNKRKAERRAELAGVEVGLPAPCERRSFCMRFLDRPSP